MDYGYKQQQYARYGSNTANWEQYGEYRPPQQEYVEALFASPPAEDGLLAFEAGDIIAVVEQGEPNGWWQGCVNGVTGWFPSNFCSAPFGDGDGVQGDVPAATSAVVLYEYEARTPEELSLQPGDVINIVDIDQDWCTGTFRGQTGFFPTSFVELHADA